MARVADGCRVYTRQYKTSRWTRWRIDVTVEDHDAIEALREAIREAIPANMRVNLVRWWLVEDAYGFLHEIKRDGHKFSKVTT